jgi:TonB family protein
MLVNFIAFCLIASTTLSAQTPSCVPNLDHLTYPAVALASRIQGTVNMSFTVDADGEATQFDSSAYPLLKVGVEEALRAARQHPECAGKLVSIRVNFELSSSVAPNSAVSVEHVSETVWQVVASLPTIEVTIYDPPTWALSRKGRFIHRVRGWVSKL